MKQKEAHFDFYKLKAMAAANGRDSAVVDALLPYQTFLVFKKNVISNVD
ncbi:MAG: hypothetical protein JXX14_01065 [Deltaproteobacteria bacterium]|nr:hypothetical protein [Deltaproteobacteria bacterium]